MGVVDFSDYDPEDLDGNPRCETPGKATLLLDGAAEKDGKKGPYYLCSFTITAHENPKCVGQEYVQFINMSGKMSKVALRLALALGTITTEDIANAKASGSGAIDVALQNGEGLEVCGQLVPSKDAKYGPTIWDFFNPTDERAASFPKPSDPEAKPEPPKPKVLPVAPATGSATEEDDTEIPF